MVALKQFREAKGWSQSQLARRSGVSQTYISELEAGKSEPTVLVVKKLAAALGISVNDLIGEESTALDLTGTEGG